MQQQETWDQLYKRKRAEQREARGAKVKHVQLKQEIADLAIVLCDKKLGEGVLDALNHLQEKHEELRALEQQYPALKELT